MKKKILYGLLITSLFVNSLFVFRYINYKRSVSFNQKSAVISDHNSDKDLSTYKYVNALDFHVSGRKSSERNYHRVPEKYKSRLRPSVWKLSKNSAGLSIHFTTNSPNIALRWELAENVTLKNTTSIASGGFDLYCFRNGEWEYVNSAIPGNGQNESLVASDMDTTPKDFILNFPLWNTVEHLEIGIENKFAISTEKQSHFKQSAPIVFYGTSITQGGSASRPGMAYPAIVSRKLNIETINLGFSGNGRFEKSVGEVLCDIESEILVIDCTANSPPDTIKKNSLKLITQLRQCHPKTPILLVESIIRETSYFKKEDKSNFGSFQFIQEQNRELYLSYQKAIEQGIKNIHYLKSDGIIGLDHEGTVDGTHLSDLGHYRLAEKIAEKINEILKLK
jgi:hypothetical protein